MGHVTSHWKPKGQTSSIQSFLVSENKKKTFDLTSVELVEFHVCQSLISRTLFFMYNSNEEKMLSNVDAVDMIPILNFIVSCREKYL